MTESTKNIIQGLAGIALAGLFAYLARLSPAFSWELGAAEKPVVLFTALMVAAGGVYLVPALLAAREARKAADVGAARGNPDPSAGPARPWLFGWIVVVGLAMRLLMFSTTPVLEDDWHRYLWDGGVTANGHSPYEFSPAEVLDAARGEAGEGNRPIPSGLAALARDSGQIIERVNHPRLKTIYPPAAQAAFALAYFMKPWSLDAWRAVILALDILALALIVAVLRELRLPLALAAVYWWNPIHVKELLNCAHMDIVMFPFLVGALLAGLREMRVLACLLLGFAAGVKVWPVILLAVALRPLFPGLAQIRERPARVIEGVPAALPGILAFAMVAFFMFAPVVMGGLAGDSGFTAYGKKWEMNDALFMLVLWAAKFVLGLLGAADKAGMAARLFTGAALVAIALWVVRHKAADGMALARQYLWVVAALFLLSPTQFPWYYLWMLPLLAVAPRPSLLLLTALLPLYYLRFYWSGVDKVHIHDYWIVWAEYAPVWALLLWEWRTGYGRGKVAPDGGGDKDARANYDGANDEEGAVAPREDDADD